MRIVADTNTVVSGLLWQGAPRHLLDAARNGTATLITSPDLLAELAEILPRNKFAARILNAQTSAGALVEGYAALARMIEPAALPQPVSRDPDDDAVIACALAAGAEAIVSGDADLLVLGSFERIPIITANQALERIKTES